MKVIVILGRKNKKKIHLILELPDRKIRKIKKLLNTCRWQEAISSVISMGKSIEKLTAEDLVHATSDLILTNTNAYWNFV